MALAMACPCTGPRSSVRRISRSRVPCSSSMRSRCSLVDMLGDDTWLLVECQGERLVHSWILFLVRWNVIWTLSLLGILFTGHERFCFPRRGFALQLYLF